MRSKALKETIFAYALLAPALVLLGLLFLNPIINLFITSLTNKNLIRPDRLNFIGIENYKWMFMEPLFWSSLVRSVIFTVIVTILSISISMGLALLFNINFFGKKVLFALLLLPWVTSNMASTFIYTLLYDYSNGVINFILSNVLKIIPRQNWLGDITIALGATMVVSIWYFLPFSILVLTNAIKQVPIELAESARIDGANSIRIFFSITLPTIRPALITLLIVRFAAVFKTFESIWLLTRGGPGDATKILPLWYYQIGFQSFRAGRGSAIGIILILMVLIVYSAVIKSFGEEAV
ncbi:MAG: sugar ABC transporter permease [Treponema sp.]|nr:sugar ABC transporter permease [Treponema sp.]